MQTWSLEMEYGFRLEFCFVDGAGCLLKTKSLELRHERFAPPLVFLVQANAGLLATKPGLRRWQPNYVCVTTVVTNITGDLVVISFNGVRNSPEEINRRIAASPLTYGVVLDSSGLHLTLHSTQ
jgi:hypothetical protein